MAEVKPLSSAGQYTLDARGYTCPYPQYYTIRALHQLREGETLEVLLDNQPSLGIVQETAKKKGCEVISTDKLEQEAWRIVIRK